MGYIRPMVRMTFFFILLSSLLACGDDSRPTSDASFDTGTMDGSIPDATADDGVPDATPDAMDATPDAMDAAPDAADATADAMDGSADAGDATADGGDASSDATADAADAALGPWNYFDTATAGSSYAAGDCGEAGDYDESRTLGAPDCTDCRDYCPTAGGTTGLTPCSWFTGTATPGTLTGELAAPVMARQVRVWVTYSAPPGDITEVAIAPSASGTFTPLTGAMNVTTCGTPRMGDDHTMTFDLASPTMVGAVRVSVSTYNTGVDAVGVR